MAVQERERNIQLLKAPTYTIDDLKPEDPLRGIWPMLRLEERIFCSLTRRAEDPSADRENIELRMLREIPPLTTRTGKRIFIRRLQGKLREIDLTLHNVSERAMPARYELLSQESIAQRRKKRHVPTRPPKTQNAIPLLVDPLPPPPTEPPTLELTEEEVRLYELLQPYSRENHIRVGELADRDFNGDIAHVLRTLGSLAEKLTLKKESRIPKTIGTEKGSACYMASYRKSVEKKA